MTKEQNRTVFVKTFDRYAPQAILSDFFEQNKTPIELNQKAKTKQSDQQVSGPKPVPSSVFYDDILACTPEMKIKGILESIYEGLILIAESEMINDQMQDGHLTNESLITSDLDSTAQHIIPDEETLSRSELLAETQEFTTKDILHIDRWLVWAEKTPDQNLSQQAHSPLMGKRHNRLAIWNRFLSTDMQFDPVIDTEPTTELVLDPTHAKTMSLIDKSEDLLLDLEAAQTMIESDQTVADDSLEMTHSCYLISKRKIVHQPVKVKTLASLVSQGSHHQEQSSLEVVRTVKYTFIKEIVDSVLPLFQLIERLHTDHYCLGGFDPALFVNATEIEHSVAPMYPLPLVSLKDQYSKLSVSGEESTLYAGFSPPEMFGYFHASPCYQSDVFSAGMTLYYALTGCPRFVETRRPFFRLPSPFVYRQDLAPEIVAVVYRAISPDPNRRQPNMSVFIQDLEKALASAKQREEPFTVPLKLEAGQEIHIGLLKGQYNPINQDDLFLGYQAELDLGLFVVTDGVSICEYGSGDLASGFVREAAVESWRDLCQMQTLTEEEDTLSEVNLGMIEGLTGNYGKFLNQLVNDSNRRIGKYINQQMPVFHGPPEGIMAATIVAAVINQGVATLTSVGDSRIYLIRNGYIISLMYDEDLYTHLLQAKQTPTQAQQSPSSSALVHCVGEFTKNEDSKLVASSITPQLREIRLLPGDQLLLCSDGLPDYSGIDEADAEEKMRKCLENSFNVHHAAFELIALANRGGGGDNLSCIVLKFMADQDA